MVLMAAALVPIVLLAEWKLSADTGRWGSQVFFALVLILEGLSVFVFTASDVLLFYLFFEATLIPMYFLIGGFGGPHRSYAATKFLLFSLAGGLIMLASVIGLYGQSVSANGQASYLLSDLAAINISGDIGRWLMAGFLIAFIIKAPMVPLHTWLPDAAEEATPGTSVLLVGVLDKIGTFGMIKFCLGSSRRRASGPPRSCSCWLSSRCCGGAGRRPVDEPAAVGRLHVGEPLRLHGARHLRVHDGRHDRVDVLHAEPRFLDGRAVPRGGLHDPPTGGAPTCTPTAASRRSPRCWQESCSSPASRPCRCRVSRRS